MSQRDACGSCSSLSTCRFGLGDVELVDDAHARVGGMCPREYAGGPDVAHGGWIAAVLDDFLGRFMLVLGRRVVTKTLDVAFLRPVPVGEPIELVGEVLHEDSRRWTLNAELQLGASGVALARAEGLFVERGVDHWERARRWAAEQSKLDQPGD